MNIILGIVGLGLAYFILICSVAMLGMYVVETKIKQISKTVELKEIIKALKGK